MSQKLVESETKNYESQKSIMFLQEIVKKLTDSHQNVNENLDMIVSEQADLNTALDAIEKQLDAVFQSPGQFSYQ